jgi:hypothetical protein
MGPKREEVIVLVKAVPHPSQRHVETVCCAGVTRDRQWRRLFPIRFRCLEGGSRFRRWQWLSYDWQLPTSDSRAESRRVFEDTLCPGRLMPVAERAAFLEPLVVGSAKEAEARGQSLALVRPLDFRFSWRPKSAEELAAERQGYESVARQQSFFDRELAALTPCPLEFRVRFRDETGWHDHQCEDWETTAAYWKLSRRYGSEGALAHLDMIFNHEYPSQGMVVALGTMAKRRTTWLLLGVIRLDRPTKQQSLF